MSTAWALLLSLLLLAGNAFFVAAEFALVASKRYRLEQAAEAGSRAARAAVAGSRELSLMLAGAQLGITACTLGLGALAEPTIEHLLEPALSPLGLPERTGTVISFVAALSIVAFLHVVVGEMAPKSWAITHPERSALLLALPFRGFARLVRPLLAGLQWTANLMLRLFRVEPQEALAAAHGPAEMRMLLERSRQEGLLDPEHHQLLSRMLPLARTSLAQVMTPLAQLATVGFAAPVEAVEAECLTAGRSRLGVVDESNRVVGLVHVRDVVRATTAGRRANASTLMTPTTTLDSGLTLAAAATRMRAARAQFALVATDGEVAGFIALEDLLEQFIGEFYDETDRPGSGQLR
jgi:CBS domain containing-hemolysin-like protein